MAKSPEELAHQEWLGYVQPVGLVVSIPAMVEAQCYVNKNVMGQHARFLSCLPREKPDEPLPEIRDLPEFARKVLGWEAEDLQEIPERVALSGNMASLEVVLPQYHETLRPTHAVPVFKPAEGQSPWMMLVQQLPTGIDLDEPSEADSSKHWNAAPQAKFERLLRETGVPIGLLSNRRQLRLVYAPKGESSGHATFNVDEMMQVAGRPMFAALHMLLCADRMFSLGDNQRLPAILENSRKYQNTVSTKLAEQVLAALYELMRGFQAADDVRQGELLREVLASDPNQVYSGLLTVLLRLVFVMYAEDRDLLSSDPIYSNYYSVTGLFNRLREDAGRFPDTMHQRFGGWSQLITLFRLIYEGGQHGDFKLPARKGYLFDPHRYPFLEGRRRSVEQADQQPLIPRVSDGIVYHVLRNLLILDGERLSYRTLDVEQIGSVYETVMGFNLEVAAGKSIAIKPVKTHGAPATINLDALLQVKGKDRAKWLKEQSDQTLGSDSSTQLSEATTIEQLLEALDKKIAKSVTPRVVPAGAIVLQPSDERRRSGSHYTPRSLTEPIVRTTLEPILKQLCDPNTPVPALYEPSKEDKKRYTAGELAARVKSSEKAIEYARQARAVGTPHPAQILELKVCDPAMGSGAFLVETCRQLGDELIKAWYAHDLVPKDIPPDEDELLYARRMIAQRCLYGVDKNIMAVDLAKLALWLVTLAKDHPFTFLDHSLRYGDSLVGLTRKQIIGFHWEPKKQQQFGEDLIQKRLDRATEARAKILSAREDVPYRDQEQRMAGAEEQLELIRLAGDVCVSAFFAGTKPKEREQRCEELFEDVALHFQRIKDGQIDASVRNRLVSAAASLRSGEHPLPPFHWEIEFPEVFARENGGFDALVGNPPFIAGADIWTNFGAEYRDFLQENYPGTGGKAVDIVAHFFRQSYLVVREGGTFGLIATKTIAQGDTREASLQHICLCRGIIYSATKRLLWPGVAAVKVSVVHVAKGRFDGVRKLDGVLVPRITAFLLKVGQDTNPHRLKDNDPFSFRGHVVYGMGFTFDDTDEKGVCTPISKMNELIQSCPTNQERIFPCIGGHELNTEPTQTHHRYIICFEDMSEEEANQWPQLIEIVKNQVLPERKKLGGYSVAAKRANNWWQFGTYATALQEAMKPHDRVLALSQVSAHHGVLFQPTDRIFVHTVIVFPLSTYSAFAALQARPHELWTRFFASSLGDSLRYTPSDCFVTFPFPNRWQNDERMERAGETYYDFRAKLMVANGEGITKTYNRFHDPHEKSPDILKLRELHAAMDRAVLEAYGWDDLAQTARCEFLLDYEEDDDETGTSKKKKPWRLRWPDDFRDEVLARLLELNEQRHQEELLLGKQTTNSETEEKKPKKTTKRKARAKPQETGLFAMSLEREHRYLLMLLRSLPQLGGKVFTRRTLNAAMILMLDDALRASSVSAGKASAAKKKTVTTINQIFTDLEIDGFIESVASEHQQLWRITETAPETDDESAEDLKRVEEVLEYFNRQRQAGKVTISEEVVDADIDLIPA